MFIYWYSVNDKCLVLIRKPYKTTGIKPIQYTCFDGTYEKLKLHL